MIEEGLAIRPGRSGDAEAIARVKVETWRSTYAGVVPDQYLLGMSVEGQTFTWRKVLRQVSAKRQLLVAEMPGAGVIGFGDVGPARDRPPLASGEVYTLYLLPDWQGRGIGRALLGRLLGALAALGHADAYLWVLADNPTRFFYERMGGTKVAEQVEPFAGAQLLEYAYRWGDLSAFTDR